MNNNQWMMKTIRITFIIVFIAIMLYVGFLIVNGKHMDGVCDYCGASSEFRHDNTEYCIQHFEEYDVDWWH